ncbi:MAG: hypothetical protein AAGA18_11500 [Verrucomicrobiota bacterium]
MITIEIAMDIKALEKAIGHNESCRCSFSEKVRVHESFQGEQFRDGDIIVSDLDGNAKASEIYVWEFDDKGEKRVATVLNVPPVESLATALRVFFVSELKK